LKVQEIVEFLKELDKLYKWFLNFCLKSNTIIYIWWYLHLASIWFLGN
jgi:hypothetical protein